jgi:hypothetical protein
MHERNCGAGQSNLPKSNDGTAAADQKAGSTSIDPLPAMQHQAKL